MGVLDLDPLLETLPWLVGVLDLEPLRFEPDISSLRWEEEEVEHRERRVRG